MSVISLDSIVGFKKNAKPESIELGNVDMGKLTAPPEGITFYYGFKESLEEQSKVISQEVSKGNFYSSVTASVEIEGEYLQLITPELVETTTFLNLNNITKALDSDVQRVWKQILEAEGIDKEASQDPKYWKNKKYLLVHPELIGKLREYEQFSHVEVIAYPYDNPEITSLCKRATIFDTKNLVSVVAKTFPEIEITLPELGMKQKHQPKIN